MTRSSCDNLSRREVLVLGRSLVVGGVAAGLSRRLLAQDLERLDVASAGAIGPMLDGPLKAGAAQRLKLELRTHAQGADAVAKAIVDGSLRADVFLPITAGPMRTVMQAGMAAVAVPVARTEMVIVYSPKSRFASQFEAAAAGKGNWWEILQEPGLRLARSNPAGDPGGRNVIFTMMLAAKKYGQANLVERVLGSTLNPAQVQAGGNTQERLRTGELDASASYKVAPGFNHLPFLTLPGDVNLSGLTVRAEHPDVALTVEGSTFYPEPLVFYAAVLQQAANPKGATAFVEWLRGDEAQGLFREHAFDVAGDAAALHG